MFPVRQSKGPPMPTSSFPSLQDPFSVVVCIESANVCST